jgi:hypothetical protein
MLATVLQGGSIGASRAHSSLNWGINMKRTLGTFAATAVFTLTGLAVPAFAANDYGSQPGYDNAIENSNGCAGAGAFGVFGPGNNMAGGADGTQTGINNSSLCGNPQR